MTDNSDLKINLSNIRKNRESSELRNRRPLPPGQTRHAYDDEIDVSDEPTDDTTLGVDDDDTRHVPHDKPLGDNENKKTEKAAARGRKIRRPVESANDTDDKEPRLVSVLMDRRVRLWLGLLSVLLGVIIFVFLFSYIHTGSLNQAVIMNLSPEEIAANGIKVEGLMGPLGAWFGYIVFAKAFGVGAFMFGLYFLMLGIYLLRLKPFNFWKLTFRCVLLAVASSIIVGLVTYSMGSTTYWGGIHGHYVNQWLMSMTGVIGALVVSLFLLGTLGTVYFNGLANGYNKWRNYAKARKAERDERRQKMREAARAGRSEGAEAKTGDDNEKKQAEPQPGNDIEGIELVSPINNPAAAKEDETERINEADKDVAFRIDETESESNETKVQSKETSGTQDKGDEKKDPEFEIDVPVNKVDKKSGSVAERLVSEQGEYDPRADLSRYKFPTLDMLENRPVVVTTDKEEQEANKERIIKTLGNYGITVESIKATVGPTVTLFEIVPTEGIRISQITRLSADIALSLAAKGIRIIAPMPGKGTVGIEVPNNEPQIVSMRTILSSKKFYESKAKLPIALGATISNEIFVTDLASMPHALVAGATGQGKSVGLNVIIASLLYRKHPSELKFVMIDPKMVEFSVYERLRGHYLASLPGEEDAIVTDSSKVLNVLNSLCVEMDNRYALLRKAAVNKIEDYNRKFCQRRLSMEKGHKYLPYIVVIIDEFADLIMTGGKDIELPVMRITQKARAVGIHMIIATQRPSTNVLTGLIKANCPSRIAFRVNQNVDSRTILDRTGADQLIGRGDMLYSQGGDMERIQCAFITSEEIETICDSIDRQPGYEHPYELPEPVSENGAALTGTLPAGGLDRDPLFDEAARFIVLSTTASTSSLQRRFEIGYNRAGKIMDQMEAAGIVGPASGSKPRSVLIDPVALERILTNS